MTNTVVSVSLKDKDNKKFESDIILQNVIS